MKNLPKLRRKQLLTVPKLMEYICLVNPSETSNVNSPEGSPTMARSRHITDISKRSKNMKDNEDKDSIDEKDGLWESPKNKVDLMKNSKKTQKSIEIDKKDVIRNVQNTLNLFRFRTNEKKSHRMKKRKQGTMNSVTTKDKTISEIDRSICQDRTSTTF